MSPTQTAPAPDPWKSLDLKNLPRHIGIIMDGNGRWAQAKKLPRIAGHRAGVESVREAVRACGELGLSALTLYCFSTENWQRPKEEVEELMKLLCWALRREVPELHKNRVVQQELQGAVRALQDNAGLCLNLALNYGGRQEILDAVNRLLQSGAGRIEEADLRQNLYSPDLPDPDLIIRTSGEIRLSNFLLWQSAYAEFHVTPVHWPDFRRTHLASALLDYQKRQRRFGGL